MLYVVYGSAVFTLAGLLAWWLVRAFDSPLAWVAGPVIGYSVGWSGAKIWHWSRSEACRRH